MPVGIEQNDFISVPVPEGYERPDEGARFRFKELNDDRIEVYHPFHNTAILGDASAIPDPSLDKAAVVLFKHMPYLIDSMKLNRPRRFETRPFAGEYSQLSHCASLGLLSVEFGGGAMDVLDGLFNDAAHLYSGHGADDNYQGHGREDLHDRERARFFERAGITEHLIESGAFRRTPNGIYFGQTRLTINRLLSEDEVTIRRSFVSNKHESRRMDSDRFQYNEEERFLMHWAANLDKPEPGRIPKALAELSMDSIARRVVLDDNEGDQLVFTDDQAALSASMDYVRHNAEHWNEPVQDLVNDLLNLAERYFFVCDHPHAQNFQYFYPRDYLHTSASLMFEQFDVVAADDPVMAWFLETAESIARDQRDKSVSYYNGKAEYEGPKPPDGVSISRSEADLKGQSSARIVGKKFVIQLPHGKKRTINPRILNGGNQIRPLSEMHPEFVDFSQERNQWVGDYEASIEIEDTELRGLIDHALQRIHADWPTILESRAAMPPAELQRTIQDANRYVREFSKRQ
jgi:hypothetical protein